MSDRIRGQIAQDFPARERDLVTALVGRIGPELSGWKEAELTDRIEAAVLRLAGGDQDKLERTVRYAIERDWRDVIASAERGSPL